MNKLTCPICGKERAQREMSLGVDATPDAGYILRILQHHRMLNEGEWTENVTSLTPEGELCRAMNQFARERRELLDAAIEKLKGG